MKIQVIEINEKSIVKPSGNWNTAKDWFPTIEIDQERGLVSITPFETSGFQRRASIKTISCETTISEDSASLFVRGEVDVQNWNNRKCSGTQKFCFAIFEGDSGHIYTHRAPATNGWMQASPETIKKRLRKLGIGADNVIQQGDFLLKNANVNAYPDSEFKHESMGAGHHKFAVPVLQAYGKRGTQYKITEPTLLIHEAVDNVQHPTITIPEGIWVVGTTAESLRHSNKRD